MDTESNFSLHDFNTFHVEAIAAAYVRFDEEPEVIEFLSRSFPKERNRLILGGGSNLLFAGHFDGMVLHPLLKGVAVIHTDRQHLWIRAMAGEVWDDLVALAVDNGWGGIENLSIIPGSVGASAVQNIGAYGVEVEALVERVEAVCVETAEKVVFSGDECGFGYRTSHFKRLWEDRFIVTAVVFRLYRQPRFTLDYPGVREAVQALGPVNPKTVRQAIIGIRQSKLPDPAVAGNAGSFFKNPVVDERTLTDMLGRYPGLPHYPHGGARFKLAAGWLIEQCGWKGRRLGRAAVHDRQALVLVNLGGATGGEILELSRRIESDVYETFGIRLEREVRVVGGVD